MDHLQTPWTTYQNVLSAPSLLPTQQPQNKHHHDSVVDDVVDDVTRDYLDRLKASMTTKEAPPLPSQPQQINEVLLPPVCPSPIRGSSLPSSPGITTTPTPRRPSNALLASQRAFTILPEVDEFGRGAAPSTLAQEEPLQHSSSSASPQHPGERKASMHRRNRGARIAYDPTALPSAASEPHLPSMHRPSVGTPPSLSCPPSPPRLSTSMHTPPSASKPSSSIDSPLFPMSPMHRNSSYRGLGVANRFTPLPEYSQYGASCSSNPELQQEYKATRAIVSIFFERDLGMQLEEINVEAFSCEQIRKSIDYMKQWLEGNLRAR